MLLQKQPNGWSCLITATAILLEENVEQLIEEVGHDGSEYLFSGQRDPFNRRGHHYSEMTQLFLKRGFAPVLIEFYPKQYDLSGTQYKQVGQLDWRDHVPGRKAILCTWDHAYACDGELVANPATGGVVPLDSNLGNKLEWCFIIYTIR